MKFRLHEWSEMEGAARLCLQHSYLHFIRHWGVDSNGPAGACLKAWVESRFGLRPTYHGGCLSQDPDARARFARDRVKGTARTACLFMQLDLLYTFCQIELRRTYPEKTHLRLFRGTHDPEEYVTASPSFLKGCQLVALNNLSSFTSNPEVAWEFGSSVWSTDVPLAKILCFSHLMPPTYLQGENEFLVLGGEYHVKRLLH